MSFVEALHSGDVPRHAPTDNYARRCTSLSGCLAVPTAQTATPLTDTRGRQCWIPEPEVRTITDLVATPALTKPAIEAETFIVKIGSAKHAGTICIDQDRRTKAATLLHSGGEVAQWRDCWSTTVEPS